MIDSKHLMLFIGILGGFCSIFGMQPQPDAKFVITNGTGAPITTYYRPVNNLTYDSGAHALNNGQSYEFTFNAQDLSIGMLVWWILPPQFRQQSVDIACRSHEKERMLATRNIVLQQRGSSISMVQKFMPASASLLMAPGQQGTQKTLLAPNKDRFVVTIDPQSCAVSHYIAKPLKDLDENLTIKLLVKNGTKDVIRLAETIISNRKFPAASIPVEESVLYALRVADLWQSHRAKFSWGDNSYGTAKGRCHQGFILFSSEDSPKLMIRQSIVGGEYGLLTSVGTWQCVGTGKPITVTITDDQPIAVEPCIASDLVRYQ